MRFLNIYEIFDKCVEKCRKPSRTKQSLKDRSVQLYRQSKKYVYLAKGLTDQGRALQLPGEECTQDRRYVLHARARVSEDPSSIPRIHFIRRHLDIVGTDLSADTYGAKLLLTIVKIQYERWWCADLFYVQCELL